MTDQEKVEFIKKNLAPPKQINAQSATLSSTFDARAMWRNKSINVIFPAAPRNDFGDDRSNSPRDDFDEPNEHSNLGMAADLVNCEISGQSGPNCGHNGVDHVSAAIDCLSNYQRDQAMRARNRDDAAKTQHSVRFA